MNAVYFATSEPPSASRPEPIATPTAVTRLVLEVLPPQVVMQEVPGEIALTFTVLGCPHRCRGCHSADTWKTGHGEPLTQERLACLLRQYQGLITCLCLMGGDWLADATLSVLQQARAGGLRTCLYAGSEAIDPRLLAHLDYLKLGPYRPALGGLASPTTNQRFYRLADGQLLNDHFLRNETPPTRK